MTFVFAKAGARKCAPGFHGNTIMHYAAQCTPKYNLLGMLVKMGCNPKAPNDLGETPLHLAAGTFSCSKSDSKYRLWVVRLG